MAKKHKQQSYNQTHKDFILGCFLKAMSYSQIQKAFKEVFGWKPSKAVLNRVKVKATGTAEQVERKPKESMLTETEQRVERGLAEEKKKFPEILKIRQVMVSKMIAKINVSGLDDREEINRLRALVPIIGTLLKDMEMANKLLSGMPDIGNVQGNVNVAQFNLSNITLADLDALPRPAAEALRFWLKANLCQACPAMAKYNEIKEVKP